MMDPFSQPGPLIFPSILAADFTRLGDDAADALHAGGDALHLDVMDGHLVPNISLGPPVIRSVRKRFNCFLDVHLMIDEPVRYAPAMVEAGANNLTFHVEAPEVKNDVAAAARAIKQLGCTVGITLKPATSIDAILPALSVVDLVLIMSVDPGFGGQSFMADQLEKVQRIKPLLRANQRIEIDGGINDQTIKQARQAGVDWFVIGSALFKQADRSAYIATLRSRL